MNSVANLRLSGMAAPTKRKKSKKALSPLLDKILSDRSNVVFNVPKRAKKLDATFFDTAALNRAIIFKYPSFDTDIEDFIEADVGGGNGRPVETCLYFPYDSARPQDGGSGVYLREPDFAEKLRYFIGIDLASLSPESVRDLLLLKLIDDVPSLDPFLMRVKFDDAEQQVNNDFLELDKVEELQIKAIITRDIYPIITKAFPTQFTNKSSRTIGDFINGLWKAKSQEAELFIQAFGLDKTFSNRILMSWKGIAYYEYKYAENIKKCLEIVRWLQSKDSEPYDLAQYGQLKELFLMRKRSTVEQLRQLTSTTVKIFRDYRECHSAFLNNNNPAPFRTFLMTANQRFWALGFCVNALDHCNYLFESEVLDKPGMKLRFDQFEAFLAKLNATVERSVDVENQLG